MRLDLVHELLTAAHLQVAGIGRRMRRVGGEEFDAAAGESDARVLASIARVIRELARIEPLPVAAPAPSGDQDGADEPFPLTADELREDLARRLDRLRAQRRPAEDPGPA